MGRDLHAFLEVKEPYTDWFKRMVEYGFTAGQDFDQKNLIGQDKLGRKRETHNHIISLDMAKELSMIQRSEKGKQARQYFIECEKRAQATPALSGPELMARALIEAQTMMQELEAKNMEQASALIEAEPKVAYHDTFVADSDTLTFATVASTLGIKESELRDLLIEHDWIYRETYTRYSQSKGRVTPVYRYSEHAHKKRYFYRKLNHDVPRFRGEVMRTLKITPEGATAVERAVKKWNRNEQQHELN